MFWFRQRTPSTLRMPYHQLRKNIIAHHINGICRRLVRFYDIHMIRYPSSIEAYRALRREFLHKQLNQPYNTHSNERLNYGLALRTFLNDFCKKES